MQNLSYEKRTQESSFEDLVLALAQAPKYCQEEKRKKKKKKRSAFKRSHSIFGKLVAAIVPGEDDERFYRERSKDFAFQGLAPLAVFLPHTWDHFLGSHSYDPRDSVCIIIQSSSLSSSRLFSPLNFFIALISWLTSNVPR